MYIFLLQTSFQVPTAPLTYKSPSMNISTYASSPNWNHGTLEPRRSVAQAAATYQNSPNQWLFSSGQQTNYGQPRFPTKLHQSTESTLINCTNPFTPKTCEKIVQQIPPNIYNVKTNPNFQRNRPCLPLKAPPGLNCQLPAAVFQPPNYLGNLFLPQIAIPPRFLGPVSINDFKRMQERFLMQKQRLGEANGVYRSSLQRNVLIENQIKNGGCLSYEDKVKKWLLSINEHMGSYTDLEKECERVSCLEAPYSKNNKMNCSPQKKSECDDKSQKAQAIRFINSNLNPNKLNANCIVDTLLEVRKRVDEIVNSNNVGTVKKCRKKNVKQLQKLKFTFLQSSLAKFKRGSNLENKIKCLKSFFAAFNLKNDGQSRLKKPNCLSSVRCTDKKTQITATYGGGKLSRKGRSDCAKANDNFDQIWSDRFSVKSSRNYITVTRESYEFNTFPSKRIKVYNSASAMFESKPYVMKKTGINHLDRIADELLHPIRNINMDISYQSQNKTDDLYEKLNGWNHFKAAVKTILKNIANLVDKQSIPQLIMKEEIKF